MPAPALGDSPTAAVSWDRARRFREGKEATPLRKAFMAIVFLAAAFAGGAVVNGPGPGWAQGLLNLVRPRAPGLVALPDGGLAHAADAGADPAEAIPSAPVPPLVVGPVPEEPPAPRKAERPAEPLAHTPTPTPEPSATTVARAAPNAEPDAPKPLDLKTLGVEPTRLEGPSTAAPAPLEVAAPKPAAKPAGGPEPDEARGWGDAPGSAPATAALPRTPVRAGQADPAVAPASLPSTTAEPAPATPAGTGWADLRRRMRELGVSRYWVEGEPDGPARFRCVIPLAGRRAVGQQFEAEGDDDFQAADAALRRVALWRATETP
jgi:hypothetical protein